MEKIKVFVVSRSESTKREADLCLSSGIVEFDDSYSHISAITANGEKVIKRAVIVIPELVIEKVKESSPSQSEPVKKKKQRG